MSSTTRDNLLGPLITTFTPAPSCSVPGVNGDPSQAWQAQQCYTATTIWGNTLTQIYSGGVADDFTCWPSTSAGVPLPTPALEGWGFYSPGLYCPVGYTATCSAALHSDGSPSSVTGTPFNFQYNLLPGETAVGCCPPGYFCTDNPQTCLSYMTTGTLQVISCVHLTETTTFDLTVPYTTSSSAISTVLVNAPLFQIVWKSTDLEMYGRPTATNPATNSTQQTGASSGLTSGDKAAIGIGVVAVIILGVCLVLGWCLLHQRKRARQGEKERQGGYDRPLMPPTDAKERPEHPYISETGGTELSELPAPTSEMPSRNPSGNRAKGW